MDRTAEVDAGAAAGARRVKLLVNPTAGVLGSPLDRLPQVTARLAAAGVQADVEVLGAPNVMETTPVLAQRAAGAGYHAVVAAGGDGTVQHVAAGLLHTGVPLGILPFGTFNNICRALHIPPQLDRAVDVLLHGAPRAVDAGVVNGLFFFEAAGVGLDATLFPLGEEIKGGRWSRLALAAATLLRFRPTHLRLTLHAGHAGSEPSIRSGVAIPETAARGAGAAGGSDTVVETLAHMVVVANAPYYGMGFAVAPGAVMDDGLLTVAVFERFTKAELLRHFAAIARGRSVYDPRITLASAPAVTIEADLPLAMHADGTPAGAVPARCRVVPGALCVLVPGDNIGGAEADKAPEVPRVSRDSQGH